LNEWSPSVSVASESGAPLDMADVLLGNQFVFENYPISPLQAELLAGVIKIE